MPKKNGKKKSGSGTSDTRHPHHEYVPEKKEYPRQLPIPGLIYPLAKNNNKKRDVFKENNTYPV